MKLKCRKTVPTYMGYMGTTGESGETFPTRILNPDIYWGISPVKSQFRPNVDPLKFDFLIFFTKIWPLPKK